MTELPSGTVTFLFTDIEGSVRLWEGAPEAMRAALARHDCVLRQSIDSHGGAVFKTVGDAVCAAFTTTPEAVAAALAAQRALQGEAWGEAEPLRVRMALHTGTAEPVDGDYLGPPLNRVARLLEAAHGGQVLLSLATQELARDHLPEGAQLRDLGEHRLRDLARPECLFQLLAPDLPGDFPPPRTLDLHPNNLPVQPTPLLGREREVAEARERLQGETRLLTLTGPGGTGKTRLALQVAADLLDQFPDGVSFVDLSPIRDPALAAATIVQALGVRETEGRSLQEALKEFLRERELLLLLDNFEQVLPAAPQVAELLAAAPRLKVLVTSRAALNLRGEEQRAVPPLAVPDPRRLPPLPALSQYAAVALFIQRASAVRADFAVTNENAPAVAEICHRLDGLPLAIELAAARVKLFAPEALLSRLSNRLKLLVGGARDLPARQQTLRDAIAWSYDLLDEAEKRLFRRLSVFAGGCTLAAAEAVCEDDERRTTNDQQDENPVVGRSSFVVGRDDVLGGISSLVEKSLLRQEEQADGEPRFGMLETSREFARERLESSGEAEIIRERHARFFQTLAEQAAPNLIRVEPEQGGPHPAIWLERLEREHDNLRAALDGWQERREATEGLRLVLALVPFWERRGHRAEGLRRLLALLTLTSDSSELRALALFKAGTLAREQGDLDTARALLQESLAIQREREDWEGIGRSLLYLGHLAIEQQGNYRGARPLYEESLAAFERAGDPEPITLGVLAIHVFENEGDHAAGRALWEKCLAITQQRGDKPKIARAHERLARMASEQGDYAAACGSLKERLALLREQFREQGVALPPLGPAHGVGARCDGALLRSLWEEDMAITRAVTGRNSALHRSILVPLLVEQGHFTAAQALLEEELAFCSEEKARGLMWGPLLDLGTIARRQGDYEKARTLFEESLALSRETGSALGILYARMALGELASDQGDFGTAQLLLEAELASLRELGRKKNVAELLCQLGTLARRQGDPTAARGLLEESLAMQRQIGSHAGLGHALTALGRLFLSENDPETARALLREGLAIRDLRIDRPGIAECLEGLATVSGLRGEPEGAARLLGAAGTVREAIGALVPLADRAEQDQVVAMIQAAAGELAIAAAWAEGRAMTLKQAVATALEEEPDA